MTAGETKSDSAANGLMANIKTLLSVDSKSATGELRPKKELCGYRESECLSKCIAARSPSTQVAGAARPATVPGFTNQVALPLTFFTCSTPATWEWPQQTRSQSPVHAIA